VETGECIFALKLIPHAFVIRSPQLRLLTLFTPAGFEGGIRSVTVPAESLRLPTGAVTYSEADMKAAVQRHGEYICPHSGRGYVAIALVP